MQLAEELVTHAVGQQVLQWLETARLDYAALARQQAVRILAEIQAVIQDEVIDDYTRVDRIVDIFCGMRSTAVPVIWCRKKRPMQKYLLHRPFCYTAFMAREPPPG